MRLEEAAEAAATPGSLQSRAPVSLSLSLSLSLSRSRNPLFLKREPAAIYLYKAEPHLPGPCKAVLLHKARLCFHSLTANSETETRLREDNLYQGWRRSRI